MTYVATLGTWGTRKPMLLSVATMKESGESAIGAYVFLIPTLPLGLLN